MPVSINRRAFVGMAVTAIAVAGVPVAGRADAAEYGYSLDGDIYQTGFPSSGAATSAARAARASGPFQVARIVHYDMVMPSEAGEMVVDHLINDGSIGGDIVDWLSCANHDGDFEGDFSDECHRTYRRDRAVLDGPGRIAVAAALGRAGDERAAALVLKGERPGDLADAVYDAIAADAVLEAEMGRIVLAFAVSNDLAREIRGLEVHDVTRHQAAVAA